MQKLLARNVVGRCITFHVQTLNDSIYRDLIKKAIPPIKGSLSLYSM